MNAKQAENLRILIRHMESLSRVLDMSKFTNPCGTPACALGEAMGVRELEARGLERGYLDDEWGWMPECGGMEDARGQLFFGLSSGDGERLFGPDCYNAWGRDNVTPQEWAAEARKVLAENGYSMDEPDAFKAFMAKVQEPRSELQGLVLEPGCHR